MNLKYVKGSYMDEIMYEGRPVLFTLDGLEEGHEEEAQQYGEKVWNWVLAHRSRVIAHAPLIANFKNKKWRSDGEPEVTAEEIRSYLSRITSIYATYKKGFDVFFEWNTVLQTNGNGHGKAVHQGTEGSTFFVHVDENFTQSPVFIVSCA